MRIQVIVVVYDRQVNEQRWIRAWQATPRGESFCVVRNVDGGTLRVVSESPRIIERPNVGLDLGVFQDAAQGRLCRTNWDWLFFIQDDWLPMELDFLSPYREIARDSNVGLIGGRYNEVPKDGVPGHCRSGGFMIRADAAERLQWPAQPMTTREQCFDLEWRSHSLMRQVQDMGLAVRFLDEQQRRVLWDQGHEAGLRSIAEFPA